MIRNPKLESGNNTFMKEYLQLGCMSPSSSTSKYIIPHLSVAMEDHSQIKLQVVFDASSITDSHVSLNDILMIGPKLQQDIRSILTSNV